MNFKEFLIEQKEINDLEIKLQSLLFMVENIDNLNESEEELFEAIDGNLKKLGLKIHKSKGILDYIKAFAGSIGKLILYIIKGDYDKAKELLKSVKKEDVLDFLYKLDLGTMHLITGPLHMIDAWTGWDLSVNVSNAVSKGNNIINSVKTAIQKVKAGVQELFNSDPKRQKVINSYLNKIEQQTFAA